MLTYQEAHELMSKARNGRRKLANNTYLEERRNLDSKSAPWPEYAVRLHSTDVVLLHPDGSQTLNSGGWRTVTTKDRINQFSMAGVYSEHGEWRVSIRFSDIPMARNCFNFADGMRIYPDGNVTGAGVDSSATRRKVLKMIREYIDGYAESVRGVGLTPPGPGDCWGCWMTTKPADGKALPPGQGDITGLDHYLSHFRERYYVPSLYWRAVQPTGVFTNPHYNPALVWSMADSDAKRGRTDLVKRDLRRFFRPLVPALVEYLTEHPDVEEEAA